MEAGEVQKKKKNLDTGGSSRVDAMPISVTSYCSNFYWIVSMYNSARSCKLGQFSFDGVAKSGCIVFF